MCKSEHRNIANGCPEYISFVVDVVSFCCLPNLFSSLFFVIFFVCHIFCHKFILPSHTFNHRFSKNRPLAIFFIELRCVSVCLSPLHVTFLWPLIGFFVSRMQDFFQFFRHKNSLYLLHHSFVFLSQSWLAVVLSNPLKF